MIFSEEEIRRLLFTPFTKCVSLKEEDEESNHIKIIISKRIPLLRLIANHVSLEKSRIIKDLQEKKRALAFRVEKDAYFPSTTTVSFLDVMKDPEFIHRLSNVLYPKAFGIEISLTLDFIEIYITLNSSQFDEEKDPTCVCENRGFYEEAACCECGGYVVFCWECGAK
jgi:hypothetical protein